MKGEIRFTVFIRPLVLSGAPLFWQFSFALQQEISFLIAQNSEPFFRTISEEQLLSFHKRFASCLQAVTELAKYDEEIALAVNTFHKDDAIANEAEAVNINTFFKAVPVNSGAALFHSSDFAVVIRSHDLRIQFTLQSIYDIMVNYFWRNRCYMLYLPPKINIYESHWTCRGMPRAQKAQRE